MMMKKIGMGLVVIVGVFGGRWVSVADSNAGGNTVNVYISGGANTTPTRTAAGQAQFDLEVQARKDEDAAAKAAVATEKKNKEYMAADPDPANNTGSGDCSFTTPPPDAETKITWRGDGSFYRASSNPLYHCKIVADREKDGDDWKYKSADCPHSDGTGKIANLTCTNGIVGASKSAGSSIREKVQSKSDYCGAYDGANCGTTQGINLAVKGGLQIANQVMTAQTQMQGSAAQSQLAGKGVAVNMADYYNAQADLADKAAKTNDTVATVEGGAAVVQTWRIAAHAMSMKKVSGNAAVAEGEIKKEYEDCTASADAKSFSDPSARTALYKACDEKQKADSATVKLNKQNEIKAQQGMILVQSAETAVTGGAAVMSEMNANMLREQANTLRKDAGYITPTPTPVFNYTGGAPTGNAPVDPGASATPVQSAVSATDSTAATTGTDTPVNPNLGDNSPAGPMAAGFQGKDQTGGGGNSGGNSLGGGGSTSGASEQKPEQAAMGKGQTGGTYGASDGGGVKAKVGMGGGGGVGVDNSFADMLKKMLDGAGDKTADAKEGVDKQAADRGPAGDSAAVLGRNTNIFEAIHKRYIKKSGEGAIVFSEGSS